GLLESYPTPGKYINGVSNSSFLTVMGGLAAMRDCMREAGSWQLRRRVGQHLLFGLPRQVRRHRRGHVPRGVRDAGGVLPGGGKGARGGGA
ncbi:hypothetical protein PMX70_02380, partial [Collinsella aerofaciens]|nr:hypothetical protein [Collinsella aerofaciens]